MFIRFEEYDNFCQILLYQVWFFKFFSFFRSHPRRSALCQCSRRVLTSTLFLRIVHGHEHENSSLRRSRSVLLGRPGENVWNAANSNYCTETMKKFFVLWDYKWHIQASLFGKNYEKIWKFWLFVKLFQTCLYSIPCLALLFFIYTGRETKYCHFFDFCFWIFIPN